MNGWIKLHRRIQEHWVWQDNKYFKYLIIILLNVNYKGKKFPVGGELFICNPGESFRSIAEWTRLFGCSKKTTVKFFKMLQVDGVISTKIVGKGNRRKHLLTVAKWEEYQQTETEKSPERKPESNLNGNPNVTPNKKDNKDNKEKKVKKELFDRFWDLYDKKDGKKNCLKKWMTIPDTELPVILENVPGYVESTPNKQYRKNPLKYLNGEHWNDEINLKTDSYEFREEDFG